ncbi:MAG: methionyl-tRNA formyltransferase [Oscillospiraceae bacterium]|nr:methionyl-tRNA formyltransferase [Oscillospiraceae bacterium]
MRIVFMGTPDFASASLEALLKNRFDVTAVFTQPDKPRGRGMEVSFCDVKKVALAHDLPVYQPTTLRTEEATELIRELNPDILVVVAYGKLIPDDILAIPRYGAVNVHGSLLPKYRGAAPIQWAVLNGDDITGITTMYLASKMDCGDIIYQAETKIGEYETSGELFDRLKVMGADLLIKTLNDIESGTAPRIPQNDEDASVVHMLDKSICPIDFTATSRQVIKKIYGLQPWPVAVADIGGNDLKIFKAEYTGHQFDKTPGTVVSADNCGIEIVCGDGMSILITEVQASGKKRMPASDYLRGHPLEVL